MLHDRTGNTSAKKHFTDAAQAELDHAVDASSALGGWAISSRLKPEVCRELSKKSQVRSFTEA